jgi:hypothetical protein
MGVLFSSTVAATTSPSSFGLDLGRELWCPPPLTPPPAGGSGCAVLGSLVSNLRRLFFDTDRLRRALGLDATSARRCRSPTGSGGPRRALDTFVTGMGSTTL